LKTIGTNSVKILCETKTMTMRLKRLKQEIQSYSLVFLFAWNVYQRWGLLLL